MRIPAQKLALFAVAFAIAAACDKNPTGGDDKENPPVVTPPTPPPAAVPAITGATLTSGGEGVLTGTHLDQLPTTATVDGAQVSFTSRTAGEARFPMPTPQACEVDGRPVAISVGAINRTDPLRVPSRLSMGVGETRTLDVAQAGCIQLPGDGSHYVLTTLHPALAVTSSESVAPETFFSVETLTGSGTAASVAAAPLRARLSTVRHGVTPARLSSTQSVVPYSDNPTQFDPRYATAGVGDRVTFADFSNAAADVDFCDRPKGEIPTYQAQIIAVSGKTVVAVDLRNPNAANHLSAASAAVWQKAADMVEPVTLPTMRIMFDAAFEPTRGGGGRRYVLVTETAREAVGSPGDGGTDQQNALCKHNSEMTVVRIGPGAEVPVTGQVSGFAGIMVHEFAHEADDIVAIRYGANGAGRGGMMSEGVASDAEEIAARLSLGQLTGARPDQIQGRAPDPGSRFAGTWGAKPDWSPYDTRANMDGPYAHGASMILYAREKAGQTAPGFAGRTLFLQMLQRGQWGLSGLAAVVGMTPTAFHAEWALADATDGLAAPGTSVPQYITWDFSNGGTKTPPEVSRTAPQRVTVAAGPGNYHALYFTAFKAEHQARGISFRVTDVASSRALVRLTRLR